MKILRFKILLSILIFAILFNMCNDDDSSPSVKVPDKFEWDQIGISKEGLYNSKIATDNSGNVYLTVSYIGTDFEMAGQKYENFWLKQSEILLLKFDQSGKFLWKYSIRTYDLSGEEITDLYVDENGNAYITGTFQSSNVGFGGDIITKKGVFDLFIVKIDASGNYVWDYTAGCYNSENCHVYGEATNNITVDKSGNVYFAGKFASSKIDFGGGARDKNNVEGAISANDGFICKLNAKGEYQWDIVMASGGIETIYDMQIDNSGNLIAIGAMVSSTIDYGIGKIPDQAAYIIKFNPDGKPVTQKIFSNDRSIMMKQMIIDNSDNIYLTGRYTDGSVYESQTFKGNGALVLKMDNNFNNIWNYPVLDGVTNDIEAYNGNVYIALNHQKPEITIEGNKISNVDPDGTTTESDGKTSTAYTTDFIILTLNDQGKYQWYKNGGGSKNDILLDLSVNQFGIYFAGLTVSGDIDLGNGIKKNLSGDLYWLFLAKIAW